jgi:hypothetical protein
MIRQDIGEDVLFPPILVALEKEKPSKKFAILFLYSMSRHRLLDGQRQAEIEIGFLHRNDKFNPNSQSPIYT